MSSPTPAPTVEALDDDDDDYTDFSPNNMLKLTEFEPLSDEEQAELDEILAFRPDLIPHECSGSRLVLLPEHSVPGSPHPDRGEPMTRQPLVVLSHESLLSAARLLG